jgi:hypothetical protein
MLFREKIAVPLYIKKLRKTIFELFNVNPLMAEFIFEIYKNLNSNLIKHITSSLRRPTA